MKDYEVLKLLIESNNGSIKVGKYKITFNDDEFLLTDDNGGMGGTAKEVLNYLKQ